MRRILIAIVITVSLVFVAKAQYVNIPDSNFRSFLIGKYPSCFNAAKQMDTTCSLIVNDTVIEIYSGWNISNIDCIQYFKSLQRFRCVKQPIVTISKLPKTVKVIECYDDSLLTNFTEFPENLETLECFSTNLSQLPFLPQKLKNLRIEYSKLSSLPILPNSLKNLNVSGNKFDSLPVLPDSLKCLKCYESSISILPILPTTLEELYCGATNLKVLPSLPNGLKIIYIERDSIKSLPNVPDSLMGIYADYSSLENIPYLPSKLIDLYIFRTKINCLPHIPNSLVNLVIDSNLISCIPNKLNIFGQVMRYYFPLGPNLYGIAEKIPKMPLCNPSNNSNHCQSFPTIQSFVYNDLNNNNKKDSNENLRPNIKLSLSNNNSTYTNTKGLAYISADSLGTYTITATPSAFYNVVPASYTHNFSTYDTLVIDTFALQPNFLKDSIAIKLTPTNWAARAGRAYPYLVSYENVGTTVLSNAIIGLQYDNSLLGYDSSSVVGVTNSGSNLNLNVGNILHGQTGNFTAYFTVKTTAVLGASLIGSTNINTASVAANDTSKTIVIGSYDPNDKQATPLLTTKQVTDGNFIDYTIRFQNTGTDTAFNVVIADTLNNKLQANQLQIVGSSHSCKTTLKDNVIFFEFLDILLPDSNKNKLGSNGFVSFKIKPISSVANGTTIPNKAAIYFDYNSPIITKAANTLIQNPLPLQLLSFSASPTPPKEGLKNWFVIASWTTLNEVNTSHFIILRSDDGLIYKSVGSIAAKGFGEYNFIDNSLSTTFKTIYYQLKMVDKNGQFTFSNVIKINSVAEKLSSLIVLNNPVKHQLQLQVNAAALNNTTASLMNNEGKVIKIFILKQGYQTIDISGFASGVYYLKTIDGNKKILIGK